MQIGLEIFFEASKNDEFPIQERIESAVANQKKIAFNFGSSLSYGFYFNKSKLYLGATEKLTEQNKARIKDWEILDNFMFQLYMPLQCSLGAVETFTILMGTFMLVDDICFSSTL